MTTALFAGLTLITFTDAQPATSQAEKDLHGTWVLVGRPGAVGAVPAAGGRVKLLTDHHWSVTESNPQTGATIKIAARRVAKFTPGAELKKAVNKK